MKWLPGFTDKRRKPARRFVLLECSCSTRNTNPAAAVKSCLDNAMRPGPNQQSVAHHSRRCTVARHRQHGSTATR